MHSGAEVPAVAAEASLAQALIEMSRKRLGMTAVVDGERRLLGIFTDGDLRRALDDAEVDPRATSIGLLMHRDPHRIGPDRLAVEAARLMEEHKINALPVVDADDRLVGALNIHDLLRARVV
jgi:arabinose-5-phosphate isomerase